MGDLKRISNTPPPLGFGATSTHLIGIVEETPSAITGRPDDTASSEEKEKIEIERLAIPPKSASKFRF